MISFKIEGEPKGKGRPRFTKSGHAYTPTATVNYENEVRFEYIRQCKGYRFSDDAPLALTIDAYYNVPKRDSKATRADKLSGRIRPVKKPDMDNVVKIIADALNDVAYRDDTQIVECTVRKFYAKEPYVKVTLEEIKEQDVHGGENIFDFCEVHSQKDTDTITTLQS